MMCEMPLAVRVDATSGEWTVDGRPVVLLPRHAYVAPQKAIESLYGADVARRVMHEAYFGAGLSWCEKEAAIHGLRNDDIFRHYMRRASERGLGRFVVEDIDAASGRARVRIERSAICSEYPPTNGHPACFAFAASLAGGMTAAAASAGVTVKLKGEETRCMASGATECLIEIGPV